MEKASGEVVEMFRELLRKKQKLSLEECIRILKEEKRGILSVNGENGYPYGMPMNHWYNEADGKLYFHCSNVGHRLDALKNDPRVSFCTYDKGCRKGDGWALTVKSVVVFGRVELVDDRERITDIATKLSYKFTNDKEYIEKEIAQHAHRTLLLVLTPEHICGKTVEES